MREGRATGLLAELHGPRALEELAALLISTGVLTAYDLRRLPPVPA